MGGKYIATVITGQYTGRTGGDGARSQAVLNRTIEAQYSSKMVLHPCVLSKNRAHELEAFDDRPVCEGYVKFFDNLFF